MAQTEISGSLANEGWLISRTVMGYESMENHDEMAINIDRIEARVLIKSSQEYSFETGQLVLPELQAFLLVANTANSPHRKNN
jgi:hypothetical protein